jgi:hypothetical protein
MLLVDGGNIHSVKKDAEVDRDAGFIIDIMNLQEYDLAVLGPKDFTLPDSSRSKMIQRAKFDWVGSSYTPEQLPAGIGSTWIKKIDGVKVGVYSYVDPAWSTNSIDESLCLDNVEAVGEELRKKCDVVVLVAHINSRDPENLAKRVDGLVDVMLLGGVTSPWTGSRQEGTVYMGNSGDRGRQIARFDILLNREKTLVSADYHLLKLEHDVPRDPKVAQMMLDFATQQEEIKFAELEKSRLAKIAELGLKPEDMPNHDSPFRYVGERECRDCHQEIYAAWRTTEHGRAFSDLIRSRESHLDEKVRRAVTGWMEKSGYVDRQQSSHLYNVQCESCHGPGNAHVDSKGEMRESLLDPTASCVKCHTAETDPDFDLESAIKKVHDITTVAAKKTPAPQGTTPLDAKRREAVAKTSKPVVKSGVPASTPASKGN